MGGFRMLGTCPLCILCQKILVLLLIAWWALFITHQRLLFNFLVRTCSIYFRNIYRLLMALGMSTSFTSCISMVCREAINLVMGVPYI